MIRKLRHKFTLILMSVAALILLAVFVSMFISTWSNNQRISESMLRQAIYSQSNSQSFRPPPNEEGRSPSGVNPMGSRIPILVAEISGAGEITLLTNQLHFMDTDEAMLAIRFAVDTDAVKGTLHDYELRWLKSEDGRLIALADISMEHDLLKNLIINSLLIGSASLTAFFLISLRLSRWTVRPVELAWERQRQFVADASHELKTPLTVILSNADMLSSKGTFTDAKKARRMEHIMAEALRMKKLVEDLLELAKSDSSERTVTREHVDFSFIATNAILTFEPIIFDERKKIGYNIQENIFIMGDEQRLQQLVSILLDNSVKYCPPGGQISVSMNETNKKSVLLAILNDGEPLPQKELAQVFERFYRVDKSRSTHGSFGLGLSIARSIVAEHDGKIWAESRENTGNCFYVSLPTG